MKIEIDEYMTFEELRRATNDVLEELGIDHNHRNYNREFDRYFNDIFMASWGFKTGKSVKAILPKGTLREKMFAAHIAANYKGYEAGTPEFNKYAKKTLGEYLEEVFEESLTPSGNLASDNVDGIPVENNPHTPVVPEFIYEVDGSIKDMIKKGAGSQDQIEKRWISFRSAISSITQIYSEIILGMKTKEKDKKRQNRSELSDFQFPKNATDEEKAQVLVNHYIRYMVAMKFISLMENSFKEDPQEYEKILSKFLPEDISKMSPKQVYNTLNKNAFRQSFSKNVLKYFREKK